MTRSDPDRVVLSSAMASNTRLAYEKGWVCFIAYCANERIGDPLAASPDSVARFLVHCATQPRSMNGVPLSMGTVVLYNSAITRRYTDAGKTSPTRHPSSGQPSRDWPASGARPPGGSRLCGRSTSGP